MFEVIGNPRKNFYVYSYEDAGTVFYVGMGTTGSDRHLHHLTKAALFMRRKLAKLASQGRLVTIRIRSSFNTRAIAARCEMRLIRRYGKRSQGGTLVNITSGGDGGDTYNGRGLCYNPRTGKIKAAYPDRIPKGYVAGRPSIDLPITCYHPDTKQVRRLALDEAIPDGFVLGRPKGCKTGPLGKRIICNPISQEHRWILPSAVPPRGWKWGRLCASNLGKIAITDGSRISYLEKDALIPDGWKIGRPGKGKAILVDGKKFESIQDACINFDTSRYKLEAHHVVVRL